MEEDVDEDAWRPRARAATPSGAHRALSCTLLISLHLECTVWPQCHNEPYGLRRRRGCAQTRPPAPELPALPAPAARCSGSAAWATLFRSRLGAPGSACSFAPSCCRSWARATRSRRRRDLPRAAAAQAAAAQARATRGPAYAPAHEGLWCTANEGMRCSAGA